MSLKLIDTFRNFLAQDHAMATFNKAIFELSKNRHDKDLKAALHDAIDKIINHYGHSAFVAKELIATIHHTGRCNIETAVETLDLLLDRRKELHPLFTAKGISALNSFYDNYAQKAGSELAEFLHDKYHPPKKFYPESDKNGIGVSV